MTESAHTRLNFLAVSALLLSILVSIIGWFLVQLHANDERHNRDIAAIERGLERLKTDNENLRERVGRVADFVLKQIPTDR